VSPVHLFSDSAGAIAIVTNPGLRNKTKHVAVAYHYTQEQVQLGNVLITHVSGAENIADGFTKALGDKLFHKHFSKILKHFEIEEEETGSEEVQEAELVKKETVLLARDYSSVSDLILWHYRLGHRNFEEVARIVGAKMPAKVPFCRVCTEAKATRHPLGQRDVPILSAQRRGQVLCADIAGPFPVPSIGGARYVLVVIDVFTHRLFTYMLKSTGEFYDRFFDLVLYCEAHLGNERVVSQLHTDGGTYFNSHKLGNFCRGKGIQQSSSAPYTQAMNGVAERNIRTLVEMVRSMLIQSNAPRRLCGEAFIYATYVLNTLPAKKGKPESRLDLWYECTEQRYLRVRPFGCAAWILNVKPQQDKLAGKGQLCILVGYEHLSHCYRLATFPRFDIVRSAHVTVIG
jgi:transposase InsO family protein